MAIGTILLTTACGSSSGGENGAGRDHGPLTFPRGLVVMMAPTEESGYILLEGCLAGESALIRIEEFRYMDVEGLVEADETMVAFPDPNRPLRDGSAYGSPPRDFVPVIGAEGLGRACDAPPGSPAFAVPFTGGQVEDAFVDGIEVDYTVDGVEFTAVADARLGATGSG